MYAPRMASYTQYNDEFYPRLTERKEKLHEVEIQYSMQYKLTPMNSGCVACGCQLIPLCESAQRETISNLYPGSISDKEIVQQSGFLQHFVLGDLILADRGFLIQDIVPKGVSVNIPPFLEHSKFSESEAKLTKSIARCRIHVERANARLKDFKILSLHT